MHSSPESSTLPSSALDCERQNERLRERCEKYKLEFIQQEERIEELEKELETSRSQIESLRNKFDTVKLKAEHLDLIEGEYRRLIIEKDELRRLLDQSDSDLDEKKRICMQLKLDNEEKSKQVFILSNEKINLLKKYDQIWMDLVDERQIHEYTKKKKEEIEMRVELSEPTWRCRIDEIIKEYKYRLHNEQIHMQKMENDFKEKLQLAEEIQKHHQVRLNKVDELLRLKNEEIFAQQNAILKLQTQLRSFSVADCRENAAKPLSVDQASSSDNSPEKARSVYLINDADNFIDKNHNTSSMENIDGDLELCYTPLSPENFLRCMKFKWQHELQPTAFDDSTMTLVKVDAVSPTKENSASLITTSDSTQSIVTSLMPSRHFCCNIFPPYFMRSSVVVLFLVGVAAIWTLRSQISHTLPFHY